MKLTAAFFGMLMVTNLMAVSEATEVWNPEPKFSLEEGTLEQTMLWISGFSYAVDAIGNGLIEANQGRPFCSPENGYIGSKVLFEILNERFAGQVITSKQATGEIMKQLPRRFPC